MRGLTAMSQSWLQLSKRMTAALALVVFCWSGALAASHALHEKAHGHEASLPGHQCAAKLLNQGQVETFAPVVTAAAPGAFVIFSLPVPKPVVVSADRRLAPGRAPPVLPA